MGVKKRMNQDVVLEQFTPRVFNLMMQGYSTAKDIRAKSKNIREHCSEATVNNLIGFIKRDWEPLGRDEREKLRTELIKQAEYMKRKAYTTIDKADKPNEVKELLNTLLKINTHIADLSGISGSGRSSKEGDVYINKTDNRQVTINVESWSEDDLEKAKQMIALKNSMTMTPEEVIEGNELQ